MTRQTAHCVKTCRYPQNRKYIRYHNNVKEERVTATVNMHGKFGEVRYVVFEMRKQAD